MREQMEMPKGIFYGIIGVCALIIFSTSLEAIIKVKDTTIFEMWLSNPKLDLSMLGETTEELYSTYLSICMSNFCIRIITPMGVAIHSYLTFTKLRVNKLFVIIWTVLLIGAFGFSIIGESLYTIFFLISSIGYITLILIILYLAKCIYNLRGI